MTASRYSSATAPSDDDQLHDELDDSFPASDPPAVTRRSASDMAPPSNVAVHAPSGGNLYVPLAAATMALLTVWLTRRR